MAKTAMVCMQCGHKTLQWVGRCPVCGAWDSLAEASHEAILLPPPSPISDIDHNSRPRLASGISELDRVLGGGIVPGATVLIAGEPGIGKSTLMLQAADGYVKAGYAVVVVSGEESLEQVAARARRLRCAEEIMLSPDTGVAAVASVLSGSQVVIVDSVQTLRNEESPGDAGSVSQVRSSTAVLAEHARRAGACLLLVGHVTKDGSVAGPRALEHLVDAVVTFEGDRGHSLRAVRSIKNRFGPSGEVGVFEMTERGLVEVADPSTMFLQERFETDGSAVGCVLEGRRALGVEVQALTVGTKTPNPKRIANGVDLSRLGVILAVLHGRAGLREFSESEVYVSIGGGLRVSDPGLDLPLALALVSAGKRIALPSATAAIGEVGLSGDVRTVPGIQPRLAELARLGFRSVLVPKSTKKSKHVDTVPIQNVREAISLIK